PESRDRPAHAAGRIEHVAGDRRPGDRAVALEVGQVPELLARRGIVGVDLFAADDDYFGIAVRRADERRRVRVTVLGRRTGHSRRFPPLGAGPFVVGNDVALRRLLVRDVEKRILYADADHEVADDHGAIGVAVPDRIGAVLLLHVVRPERPAREVVGGEI